MLGKTVDEGRDWLLQVEKACAIIQKDLFIKDCNLKDYIINIEDMGNYLQITYLLDIIAITPESDKDLHQMKLRINILKEDIKKL